MVLKRADRKLKNTSRARSLDGGRLVQTNAERRSLPGLSPIADGLNAAVLQCIADADPEAVHRLRTGTRRVQAMLEAELLAGGPVADALEQPARAWLRQLRKVRQAAGPVRDLDVHRKLLEDWGRQQTPESMARLGPQLETLALWLTSRRKKRARRMQKQVEQRRQRLMERQCMVLIALSSVPADQTDVARSADAAALSAFVRVSEDMPILNADNLHEFRKATKKARYVSEAEAEGQKASKVARALKDVQDAIGVWHDWAVLAEEAKGLKTEAPELTAALESEAAKHFIQAIQTTQAVRDSLPREAMNPSEKVRPQRSPKASRVEAVRKRA